MSESKRKAKLCSSEISSLRVFKNQREKGKKLGKVSLRHLN